MLSMSLMGLYFPPGYLLVGVILLNRFFKNRYDFLIMLTIALGGYGMADPSRVMHLSTSYAVLIIGVTGMMVLRKAPIVKKVILLWLAFAAVILGFALLSEESMSIQFRGMVSYLCVIWLFVPLMVFSGRDFDIMEFFRKIIPYAVIICIFYILDAYVMCGNIFAPATFIDFDVISTYYNPRMSPLSMHFVRKYPPGMYLLTLALIPVARYYKLRTWQWVVIIIGILSTRTFTVIISLVIAFFLFKGRGKQVLYWVVAVIALMPALYFVDAQFPETVNDEGYVNSKFRIKSSFDQLIGLANVQDEEDFAKTGSGRMAQVLPKLERVYELNKQWTGLGFLDRVRTKNPKFIIYNEFYENPEDRIEVASGIEIDVFQVFVTIGYIGLILHILFYVLLWRIARKLKYIEYFVSVALCFVMFGFGGFSGLVRPDSLILIGLAYGVVILQNRPHLPGFAVSDPKQITT